MKQLIKRVIKKAWNLTAPVRRPIARRVDSRLTRLMAQAIQSSQAGLTHASPLASDLGPHFEASNQAFHRVEYSLGAMHAKVDRYSTEVDLVLNSLLREIARLQAEVEDLRTDLDRATHQRPSGLSLVDGLADEEQRIARVG